MLRKSKSKNGWFSNIKAFSPLVFYVGAILTSFGIAVKTAAPLMDGTAGPEMTTQTWPAGTFLANFPEGDRINTYHRNYFMISGQEGTGIWDISNPTSPTRLAFDGAGNNGHRWWKLGDLYYREYSVPEVAGTGYKYLDLSNMLDHKPITSSDILYTVADGQPHYDNLETFPHTVAGNRVFDMRTGEEMSQIPNAVSLPDIVVRMGNYVFYAPQSGEISVFDFGDPRDIKFLGAFGGDVPHEQYSTGFQIWRNYFIYMSGNEGDNSLVAFDISDPTDVKHAFNISSDEITLGRYMIFQDEYGFTGRFDRGVKYNFETMEVEQEFFPPSNDETLQFLDNQWMPIGHILVASGDGKTSIFSHQDDLDTRPPTVGYHFPLAGATNLPVTSTIGFVINETLDDLTLNDQTIQVSPLGGSPIEADITTSSYQVINYAPKEELLPNTTYEVKFVEGGIEDAVGNGIEEYVFYFTTGGDASNQSPEVSGIDTNIPSPILVNTPIDFTANATDPEGNTLSYRWDFGDGSDKTDWIGSTSSYAFSQPGNYLVQAQVSDNNGGFVVASQSITVVASMPSSLPTQSGPLSVDAGGRTVWSVNPDNNTVSLINADDLSVIQEIGVGQDPVSVALDENGNAWIACRDSDELYVLNADGTLNSVVPLARGSQPYGVVFTPDGSRGFVSAFGSGKLHEVSPTTKNVVGTLDIGPTPRALAITGDASQLLVTRFISPETAGQVWKVDLNTFTLNTTIPLVLDDFTPDNGNGGRGLPNYVAGISIHPDNKTAWSVAKKDNILRGIARDGRELTFDNVIRTAVSPINLEDEAEILDQRLDIDNHGQPSSALYSPTGNYLFLTMQGNNSVIVIDPIRGLELLTMEVGKAPQGLVVDPQTNRLFVKNFMDRSVTVFDAEQMILNGSNTVEELATINTVASEVLSPTELLGKKIFYDAADIRMGTDGYVSCATCHIDGTQDGQVWDFTDRGEGLRNTVSLKGRAGTGHGRVHWSANFDEIQDFENDIRFHFKGQGFMSDTDFNESTTALTLGNEKEGKSVELDALVAYVESLDTFEPSPYKNDDGSLTADAIAGKAIFQSLECTSCHGGEDFTDSETGKLHDVGTITSTSGNRLNKQLQGIDVPTLRDVWATAPYLHNGAAKTLQEVFTTYNTEDGHGATSTLSSAELNQLIAYIQQIDGDEPALDRQLILEMASPIGGGTVDKADPVGLSVNTNITGITKIAYYVDGELVDEVTTSPFESNWSPVVWKTYDVSAKVFYNNGNTASITPEVKVKYKKSIKVMFVVGDAENLTTEDQRIKSRLEQQLGFNIILFSDEEADRPEVANPYDMILVSSSVEPGVLGNDLESVRIPVMTWDPFMYGKLRMTSGSINSDFGFTPEAFGDVTLTEPDHPMAVGLGASASLYQIVQPMPFGEPSEGAIIVAQAGDYPILFGYEAGGTMPSRRVGFPLRDQFMHLLTEDGWKMFDAAILWTLHGGDAGTPVAPLPDVFFKSPIDGELVNTPLRIEFETENWSVPSDLHKLRFKIDGSDRGLISSEGVITDGTILAEGPHQLILQMERSNNSLTELGDTITVIVTNDPLPEGPTAIIQSPIDGGLVGPDFEVVFSTYKWDIEPDGRHLRYFVDGVDQGAVYEIAPIPLQGLADGEHTVELALAEADGQLTGSSSEVTVTVDEAVGNLPETPFRVEYMNNSQNSSSPELKPVFRLVNDSSQAFPYADFKIRYWFTPEHTATMNFGIDYSQISGVTGTFGAMDGENYVELGFGAASGNLPANGKSGDVKTRMHHDSYLTHDQSNDYSYDPSKTSLKPSIQVTLYFRDELVWGLEPTGDSGNRRPVAAISVSDVSGLVPLEVDFDASGSSDPDGDPLTYAWDFGDGNSATGEVVSHTYLTSGAFEATLTVNDGNGSTDTERVTITVVVPNIDPIASIETNLSSGEAPLTVSFDASGSSDENGDALSYSWDFGDGNTATGEVVDHLYAEAGTYEAQLLVDDGNGGSDTEVVTILVSAPSVNVDPVAVMSTSVTSGFAPLSISFDASASSDANGDELSYSWDFGDGNTATGESVDHIYTEVGTYEALLSVSDGNGGSDTETTEIMVAVPGSNNDPVAVMSTSTTSGSVPLTVSFDASGSSDEDGDVLTYSWDFGDGSSDTGIAVDHVYTAIGSFNVVLTVDDGNGGTGETIASITVTSSGGGGDCAFGTPTSTPLSTTGNASYDNVHVLGSGGPDLSNVSNFTINWDLQNNGLWQMSINTSNGNPSWWIDLSATIVSESFGAAAPEVTFEGTGFAGFDGDYYVATVAGDFVMVSKSGSHTIYFSNDPVAPDCDASQARINAGDLELTAVIAYPNPTSDEFTIDGEGLKSVKTIFVYDQAGMEMLKLDSYHLQSGEVSFGNDFGPGAYIMHIILENDKRSVILFKK